MPVHKDDFAVKKKLVPSPVSLERDWDKKSLLTLTLSMMLLISIVVRRCRCSNSFDNSASIPAACPFLQKRRHILGIPGQ